MVALATTPSLAVLVDDVLSGQAGADQLRGGAGNDTLYADSTDTIIEGGAGTDTLTC